VTEVDALVIGGGYYGCRIAIALKAMGFARVRIVEREPKLMQRASYVNQARVHNGYHYPRSLPTAVSSRRNFDRFVDEHHFAVVPAVEMVYGIARNSRVTASQFARFCQEIGAPCRENKRAMEELFDPVLIENCFSVTEIAFDTSLIADNLIAKLHSVGVDCYTGSTARVLTCTDSAVHVETSQGAVHAQYVFNCTYAYLDAIGLDLRTRVKKELAEVALIQPPREMNQRAVTIMDGPFFSSMPFPALSCYSLTHVRYTPHASWTDPGDAAMTFGGSRAQAMLRDATRYMPCMRSATYLQSLYELKAVLARSEESDSRPILFEQARESDRVYSVLGAKIDNIYEVLAYLELQQWPLR
jgi:glycine/D-amino acid oxidase-like deaminating enzyme